MNRYAMNTRQDVMTTDDAQSEGLVLTRVVNGVMTITLNEPKTGNALAVAMTEALAGADLMQGSVEAVRERLAGSLHRIPRALHALPVPSIAAVNGAAVGAGFDVALMCDLRIAAENARFSESFLRLGLVSGIGGAWFLTRIVGVAKTMELTLTSEFIDAFQALDAGIVSRVVAVDALDAEAVRLAETIANSPPHALRMAKQLVRQSAEASLPTALEMAASMQAILLCGEEHKAAVRRFLK